MWERFTPFLKEHWNRKNNRLSGTKHHLHMPLQPYSYRPDDNEFYDDELCDNEINAMKFFKRRQKKTARSPKSVDSLSRPVRKTPFWMFWKKKARPPTQTKKPRVPETGTLSQPKTLQNTPKRDPKRQEEERAALIAEALDIHREGQKIWEEVDPGLREGLARMVRGAYGLTEPESKDEPSQKSVEENQAADPASLTPPPAQRK